MNNPPDVDSTKAADSLLTRAQNALELLRSLQLEHLAEMGVSDVSDLTTLPLQWHIGMRPEELHEQLRANAQQIASDSAAVIPGRVYCYHCRRADCEHSIQADVGQVFAGYGDTGRPKWEELFNFLTNAGDDRIDLLFEKPPRLLAKVIGRKRLIAEQLVAFGRGHMTYYIIGQVVAGYLRIGQARTALTVQIVEDRNHRLFTQVISPSVVVEALADAPEQTGSTFFRVFDALREIDRQVTAIATEWLSAGGRQERLEVKEKIFGYLRHLAHSIERKGRQSRRRTSHAELRSRQQRPVHKAFDDVQAARPEDFFRDSRTDSIVIAGKNGRSHVYNEQGRHITSLCLLRDEFQRRLNRRRYVPLPGEIVKKFLAAVNAAQTNE